MIHISLGRARWSQDVGVLAMIPVGSYPVCYLGHVLICLCLHVSMGLGLQSGICGTRWSLAQHVPLTKPCPANDVTCVDLLMMWIMMVGSISPPPTLTTYPSPNANLNANLNSGIIV